MSNPIKDSYKDGICPDCKEPIPDDVSDGDSCKKCGHISWEEDDDFYDKDYDDFDDDDFDDDDFDDDDIFYV